MEGVYIEGGKYRRNDVCKSFWNKCLFNWLYFVCNLILNVIYSMEGVYIKKGEKC